MGTYVPPTPWVKCSTEEKLERMRDQIKLVQSEGYRTGNFTRRLRQLVSNHKHLDGKVVEDVREYEGSGNELTGSSLSQDPSQVYF